ncbi:MAG TPA: iron-containing redox enzyme family protein, partial [Streptomyces sp.]|nr:iron-containing redox enzyme family protein [Streptomyces sp.]
MSRHHTGPSLPRARGVLSAGVIDYLQNDGSLPDPNAARSADPYGDDLQLALYICYELHYRGFAGVRPELEWDPPLLAVRAALEDRFLVALRRDATGTASLGDLLDGLLLEPVRGTGLSWFLQDQGELRHLRDYAVQRSLYHLK